MPSEVAWVGCSLSRFSPIEPRRAPAWASVAGAARAEVERRGRAPVAAIPASASRRLIGCIVKKFSPLAWGKNVLGLDLQAIAFDVDDADAIARVGRSAPRRPFAVADADSAAMRVDRLDDHHDLAEEARPAVVEMGIGGVIVARGVEAPAEDPHRHESKHDEDGELQRNT